MRETKDQKINRLQNKTVEQYEELKTLRKEKNSLKLELERLKKGNVKNEIVINDKIENYDNEIISLNDTISNLQRENLKLKEKLEDISLRFAVSCRENRIDSEFGLNNLAVFWSGGMTDKMLMFLFDVDTLVPNIDLLTGEYIEHLKQCAVEKELKMHKEYYEALEKIAPFKEKIKKQIYPEEYPIFLDVCKSLIKYYYWVFFPNGIVMSADFDLQEWLDSHNEDNIDEDLD